MDASRRVYRAGWRRKAASAPTGATPIWRCRWARVTSSKRPLDLAECLPRKHCLELFLMLYELHVRNYAVIDNLAVEFYPGLNLLSGETGSGKSIIVDALGLALGARASPDIIRTGADRASITAIFRCGPVTDARRRSGSDGRTAPASNPSWTGWFEEYGLAGAAESEVILRREIQATASRSPSRRR